MKAFSTKWISSKKPKKQRKYILNAPLHIRRKRLYAHLSKELRQKYQKRSVGVRKGDKVKIMRGQFKGVTGSIEKVLTKKGKVYITKVEMTKKDGSKTFYPISASKLMINELKLDDPQRKRILEVNLAKANPKTKIEQESKK